MLLWPFTMTALMNWLDRTGHLDPVLLCSTDSSGPCCILNRVHVIQMAYWVKNWLLIRVYGFVRLAFSHSETFHRTLYMHDIYITYLVKCINSYIMHHIFSWVSGEGWYWLVATATDIFSCCTCEHFRVVIFYIAEIKEWTFLQWEPWLFDFVGLLLLTCVFDETIPLT